MKPWHKIIGVTVFTIMFMIGMFMIGLHLACTRTSVPPLQTYIKDHVYAELYYVDQGAWGSYVKLEISELNGSSEETISIRSEDSKPTLDSIVGKDVYISYRDFPGKKHTTLQLHEVLLGDALLRQDSLKYAYHFNNHKSTNQ